MPEGLSDDMKDLLKLCFEKDPSKRIDAKNLLKHKLLNQLDKNELQKIINTGPKELTSTIKMHLDKEDELLSMRQMP